MPRLLFIGDVIGKPGRRALKERLSALKASFPHDLLIVNGENAAGGFSITPKVAAEFFSTGVDVITSGNHIWDKKEAPELLNAEARILRPLNYPPGVPGFGSIVAQTPAGDKVGVINLSGRVFMPPMDCPFRTAEEEIEKLAPVTKTVLIDFHAEATSEKLALLNFLDGKVSAIVGTHTHVQTADEKIYPGGTAYITDAGMTGPDNSVIGMKVDSVLERFLRGMPARFEPAEGPVTIHGVYIDIDGDTGRAVSITRVRM